MFLIIYSIISRVFHSSLSSIYISIPNTINLKFNYIFEYTHCSLCFSIYYLIFSLNILYTISLVLYLKSNILIIFFKSQSHGILFTLTQHMPFYNMVLKPELGISPAPRTNQRPRFGNIVFPM